MVLGYDEHKILRIKKCHFVFSRNGDQENIMKYEGEDYVVETQGY